MATTLPHLNNANYIAVLQKNGLSEDQFWSKTLQKMIVLEQSEFVFTRLAKKESIPTNYGTKNWSVRRYLHLPVDLEKGKLAEGVAPTPMKVEGKMVSGKVDQYGAYIELTDVAKDIHFDDIFGIYQPELARHAAETIERALIDSLEAEASVSFAGAATSKATVASTHKLTWAVLRKAWLTMKNHRRKGHPSAGGKPIFVAHPNVLQDLLDDTSVIKDLIIVPGYDEKIVKSGSIAQYTVYGIYLMETSVLEPSPVGVDSSNVYPSFLIGGDSYVLLTLGSHDVKWYKKGFAADSGDPLGQKATVGYKLWTGSKVIDPMAITAIYSASGFDSTMADWGIDYDARPANQGFDSNSVLRIAKEPNKVTYATTDTALDLTGLIVTATDVYGSEIMLKDTEYTVSTVTFTAGTKTVTVTHTATTKTATFTVTVA